MTVDLLSPPPRYDFEECPACLGWGHDLKERTPCGYCEGEGHVPAIRKPKVEVKR